MTLVVDLDLGGDAGGEAAGDTSPGAEGGDAKR